MTESTTQLTEFETKQYEKSSLNQGRKLTSPNINWSFLEFSNPFCFFSSQLDLERPIQMTLSVLPKQLEKAGKPASCSQNV